MRPIGACRRGAPRGLHPEVFRAYKAGEGAGTGGLGASSNNEHFYTDLSASLRSVYF